MPSTWSQEKYIGALKYAAEAHSGQTLTDAMRERGSGHQKTPDTPGGRGLTGLGG